MCYAEFEGDEFATSAMYEALQQVKRAVRRTNHKWQSDVSVDQIVKCRKPPST